MAAPKACVPLVGGPLAGQDLEVGLPGRLPRQLGMGALPTRQARSPAPVKQTGPAKWLHCFNPA